jgi:hypothetical protein
MAADRTQLEHDLRFRDHHSFEAMRPRASQINEVTNNERTSGTPQPVRSQASGYPRPRASRPKCS